MWTEPNTYTLSSEEVKILRMLHKKYKTQEERTKIVLRGSSKSLPCIKWLEHCSFKSGLPAAPSVGTDTRVSKHVTLSLPPSCLLLFLCQETRWRSARSKPRPLSEHIPYKAYTNSLPAALTHVLPAVLCALWAGASGKERVKKKKTF